VRRLPAAQFVTAIALTVTFGPVIGSAEGIAWHETFEAALGSAQTSESPLMVFAFRGTSPAVRQMAAVTLVDEDVTAASRQFKCVALDVSREENEAAVRRLRLGPVEDAAGDTYGAYPVTVFLDHTGKEQFRRHGYLPPAAFASQLNKAHRLLKCLDVVAERPDDARAHRELGRAYMEMDIQQGDPYYEAVAKHLQQAIELDPDNVAGASFDARVDLAIFGIPDAPQESFSKLFELQTEAPESERRFEMQYYMAVAQYAMGHEKMAADILLPFHTNDANSRYFHNEWTAQALTLLYHIRRELKRPTGDQATP